MNTYHGIKPVTPADMKMARNHLMMNKTNLQQKIVDHRQAAAATNNPASKRYNQSHLVNHQKDLTKVNQSLQTLSKLKGVSMAQFNTKKTGSYKGKSNAPGGGGRFQQMTDSGMSKGLAAYIGRRKYGAGRMAKMAAAGK